MPDADVAPVPPDNNFDSSEEEWFSWMLEELLAAGQITRWYRPPFYVLSSAERRLFMRVHKGKVKAVEKDISPAHIYTPDFACDWSPGCSPKLVQPWAGDVIDNAVPFTCNVRANGTKFSVFEVKPLFNAHGKTQWSGAQIKWVAAQHKEHVQMVKIGSKPKSFFDKVFTPDRYRLTDKTLKPRAIGYTPRTLEEFLATPVDVCRKCGHPAIHHTVFLKDMKVVCK